MKSFFSFILFILSSQANFAQQTDAVLSGKANPALSYLKFSSEINGWTSLTTDSIKLFSDGAFQQRLKITKPLKIYLEDEHQNTLQLWLQPGDSLHVDLVGAEPVFTGSAASYASYFIDSQKFWSNLFNEFKRRNPDFDKSSQRFNEKYFSIQDSIMLARMAFLKTYFSHVSGTSAKEFITDEYASLMYLSLYSKLSYEGAALDKFRIYQDRYKLKPAPAYAFSDQVNLSDEKLIDLNAYRRFASGLVTSIVHERISKSGQKFDIGLYLDLVFKVTDELTEGSGNAVEIKSVILNDVVDEIARERKLNYAGSVYSKLSSLESMHTSASVGLIRKKLDETVTNTRFNKGMPAFDFKLMDPGKSMYNLSSFRGKKIYIDISASWCGPCISGILAWNKLVEQNAGNDNVAFVSLSIDDREETWTEFLKKYSIKGIQLFSGNGGFKSRFAADYNIAAIPHFILIDEVGKIIKYSAPGPESEEIHELLKQKN